MKIGFIGLGLLGTPIALNLLESHPDLLVYNRTTEKTKALTDKGAVASTSVAELASACDVVFSIVSNDAALNEVCGGAEGLIKHLKEGAIHVSMSTILPETATKLTEQHAAAKQHYIAAPVFGRPDAAAKRMLQFAIAGDAGICERVTPLLNDAGAARVWNFGPEPSAANVVKISGNYLIASAMQAIGETVAITKSSGVDPNIVWQMFTETLFNCPIYKNYSPLIINQRFEPTAFKLSLGLKDMNLVNQHADSVGASVPLAKLLRSRYQAMTDAGKGDIDWSAIGQIEQVKQ
jgi:3-hydroxyisobutyrate dehydrogenase-like beta-hydroxyacid dehydrogenase